MRRCCGIEYNYRQLNNEYKTITCQIYKYYDYDISRHHPHDPHDPYTFNMVSKLPENY